MSCPECGTQAADYHVKCQQCGFAHSLERELDHALASALSDTLESGILHLTNQASLAPASLCELHLKLPDTRLELIAQVVDVHATEGVGPRTFDIELRLLNLAGDIRSRLESALYAIPPPATADAAAAPVPTLSPTSVLPTPAVSETETATAPLAGWSQTMDELLSPWRSVQHSDRARMKHEAPAAPTKEEVKTQRPPEEVAQELTDFTRQLVQAITKASYYTAEHEHAASAKTGLYDAFRSLLGDRTELTYLARQTSEKRWVLVYGLFDEPTDLTQVMLRGMAELYTSKLSSYFEARQLCSISFKRSMTRANFVAFVDLLATPAGAPAGAAKRFSAEVAARRIHNISVVFLEDRLSGRKLTWRVEVALTRLKKDLTLIPMFEHLNADELRGVRLQVFADVVRPLRQVSLILELLENCDLVVADLKGGSIERVEADILRAVPERFLTHLLTKLAAAIITAKRQNSSKAPRILRLIRPIAERLAGSQAEALEQVFRELHQEKVLKLDELPTYLQEQIFYAGKAQLLAGIWKNYIRYLDVIGSALDYDQHLRRLQHLLPELLRLEELECIERLLNRLSLHRRDASPVFHGRQGWADSWFKGLHGTPASQEIERRLLETDQVKRSNALELCRHWGPDAIELVARCLSESQHRSVRQALCQFLADNPDLSLPTLQTEIQRDDLIWYYARNLIMVLSHIGRPETLHLITSFLDHEEARVRRETLLAVSRVAGSDAEPNLVAALADEDESVRLAALEQLAAQHSVAPVFFDTCKQILDDADEALACRVSNLLKNYREGAGQPQAVALLLDVLGKDDQLKGLWSNLRSQLGSETPRENVMIAACKSLARLAPPEAVASLRVLTRSKNARLKRAASYALESIAASESVQT